MRLSEPQMIVLRRLNDHEPPDNQPDTSENFSVDALIRRGLVRFVRNRYEITKAGEELLHKLDNPPPPEEGEDG